MAFTGKPAIFSFQPPLLVRKGELLFFFFFHLKQSFDGKLWSYLLNWSQKKKIKSWSLMHQWEIDPAF